MELVILGSSTMFALVIGVIILVSQWSGAARARVRSILTEFAEKRVGVIDFVETPWWRQQDNDAVEITAEGFTFRVRREFENTGDTTLEYTSVSTEVPVRFRLNVFKEGFTSGLGKRLGSQDIVIGYPTFDDAFIVRSSHITWTKTVLSLNHDVRASHEGFKEAIVSLKDGELVLRKLGVFAELPEVEKLLDLAIVYAVAIRDTEPPLLTDDEAAGTLTMTRATGTEGGLEVVGADAAALTPSND